MCGPDGFYRSGRRFARMESSPSFDTSSGKLSTPVIGTATYTAASGKSRESRAGRGSRAGAPAAGGGGPAAGDAAPSEPRGAGQAPLWALCSGALQPPSPPPVRVS